MTGTVPRPGSLKFRVAGVTFIDGYPDNLLRLREPADAAWQAGECLTAVLRRNPANPYDSNAVEIWVYNDSPWKPPTEAVAFCAARQVHRDGCWDWAGATDLNGYGMVNLGHQGDRGRFKAHVVSLATVYPRPVGAVCRHLCGSKSCTNPDHLEWGTQADNVRDAQVAGAHIQGEKVGGSRLTEVEVVAIRERFAAGATQAELASIYGVSRGTISSITRGENWAHVGGPITLSRPAGSARTTVDVEPATVEPVKPLAWVDTFCSMVGHMPAHLAARAAPHMDAGVPFAAEVVGVAFDDLHPDKPGLEIRVWRRDAHGVIERAS